MRKMNPLVWIRCLFNVIMDPTSHEVLENVKKLERVLQSQLNSVKVELDEIDPPKLIPEEEFLGYFNEKWAWSRQSVIRFVMIDLRHRRYIPSWRAQHLPVYYLLFDTLKKSLSFKVSYVNLYNPKFREWDSFVSPIITDVSASQHINRGLILGSSPLRVTHVGNDQWRSLYDVILHELRATENVR